MGMDLREIVLGVEEKFGVNMRHEDFNSLARDRDILVGDLYELILRKLHARETVRTDVRLNFAVWEELQQQIALAAAIAAERVQLKTPLEILFPPQSRRADWEAMRAASPYQIAKLDYPRAVRWISLSLAAAMGLLEQFKIWQIPGAPFLWPVLGVFGIWIFAETYGKVLWMLSAWRNRFPQGMKTVKDLVRKILASNSDAIVAGKHGPTARQGYLPVDDRAIAVWQQLRQIISESLGVNIEKVTLESRLIGDLGAE